MLYNFRIAQIGNIAGVGSALSKEQHNRGCHSTVFVFSGLMQRRFGGVHINYNSFIEKKLFYTRLKFYDVWHYHYPFGDLYAYLRKNFKKKIFLKHYHGSDIRNIGKQDHDFCVVSTPDLLRFTPNGKWLPNPIDLALIRKYKKTIDNYNRRIRIAHYPYYRNKPEWMYVKDLIDNIKKHSEFEIIEVFDMNNEKCLETISGCDIIIGKIIPEVGWFGKFELEAMALGKPVIAYVSDELYDIYKPPIFKTTKNTFVKDLEYLVNDKSLQKKLGIDGAKYIDKYHDLRIVTDKITDIYNQLRNNLVYS